MTEWIKWDGGECPIPNAKAGEFVVKYRHGYEEEGHYDAKVLPDWVHGAIERPSDIIAYRLIEKEPSDLEWLEDALVELNKENIKRRAAEYSERGLAWFNAKSSAYDEILDLIKARKEAKS